LAYEPVYEDLPGWDMDIMGVRRWQDLPKEARDYIARIEAIAGLPVKLISVGPEREQVISRA
jgi:adenylosuccinate synthase